MEKHIRIEEKNRVHVEISAQKFTAKLSDEDKVKFLHSVDEIVVFAIFRPEELNTEAKINTKLRYEEILYVKLKLLKPENIYFVSMVIMRKMKYPVILLHAYGEKFKVAFSKLNPSKKNYDENRISGLHITQWCYPEMDTKISNAILWSLDISHYTYQDMYDLFCKIYNDLLSAVSSGLTKKRRSDLLEYLCGKKNPNIDADNFFSSCTDSVFYPPKVKGKSYLGKSNSYIYQYDLEDVWVALIRNPYTHQILINRRIDSMEELKYKFDYCQL